MVAPVLARGRRAWAWIGGLVGASALVSFSCVVADERTPDVIWATTEEDGLWAVDLDDIRESPKGETLAYSDAIQSRRSVYLFPSPSLIDRLSGLIGRAVELDAVKYVSTDRTVEADGRVWMEFKKVE